MEIWYARTAHRGTKNVAYKKELEQRTAVDFGEFNSR